MNAVVFNTARRDQRRWLRHRAVYYVLIHDGDTFVPNARLTSIVLDNGALIVGGTPIYNARFTADHIAWVQQSAGLYSAGHIYLHGEGLNAHGVVYQGTSRADAVSHDFIGTSIKPAAYRTAVTTSAYPDSSDHPAVPSSDWRAGPELAIGYEMRVGFTMPEPVVALGGRDVTRFATWSVDAKGEALLFLALDDAACAALGPDAPRSAWLAFDISSPHPTGAGAVTACCGPTPPPGQRFLFTATPVAETARLAIAPLRSIPRETLTAAVGALTIADLMTILPDDTVTDYARAALLRNMKWAMGQDDTQRDWLDKFLGQIPPTIESTEATDLIRSSLSWYQSDFAKAYLTEMFQKYDGHDVPEYRRLNDQQAAKLDEYFVSGLAASADYSKQQSGLYVEAFRTSLPAINAYLSDGPGGGEKWAQALFEKLTDGAQFTLMVNRVAGALGDKAAMAPVNNFASLLTALQPDATLARSYFKSILTGTVTKLAPKAIHSDKDMIMQWLPSALEAILRHFADHDGDRPDGVDITEQEAKDMLDLYLKSPADISSALGDLIAKVIASDLLDQIVQLEDQFGSIAERWPAFAKASKLLFALGWIGSVSNILVILIKGDWSKMTDVQKAQFVTDFAKTTLDGFDAVPEIYNGVKSITVKVWSRAMSEANAPELQIEMQSISEQALDGEDLVVAVANEVSPLLEAGAAETSAFARIFAEGVVSGVVKIFGAVAALAMAGYSLWQAIKDIEGGKGVTIIVLDFLIVTANLVSAGLLIAGLMTATSIFPPAAALAALAGAILSIIEVSLEPPPPNPIDDFMKDVGIPWVDAYSSPLTTKQPSPQLMRLARTGWAR
ncbi:hypothetical protein IC762_28090 [Bradyrhizobium genosp. L]|uniref:hypothetical protein n=1 Tax=Bradyrhizobium genosp. L TaxID=83637 RepID=UPI0018A325A9|nr:hypothetical protein [Bradyrhizobium genosp. L]QPF83534.1 hypothetical protein IC762_28090 [Bradyrhizobium genosp. L]